MTFVQKLREKASALKRSIVFPESGDDRSDARRSAHRNAHRGVAPCEHPAPSYVEQELREQLDRLAALLVGHRHTPGRSSR